MQGVEDSCLVDGYQAIRLLVQKSAILTETTDNGNKDDSEGSKRRTRTSLHLWCSKMAMMTRETQ